MLYSINEKKIKVDETKERKMKEILINIINEIDVFEKEYKDATAPVTIEFDELLIILKNWKKEIKKVLE
jgi:hypothetical protein